VFVRVLDGHFCEGFIPTLRDRGVHQGFPVPVVSTSFLAHPTLRTWQHQHSPFGARWGACCSVTQVGPASSLLPLARRTPLPALASWSSLYSSLWSHPISQTSDLCLPYVGCWLCTSPEFLSSWLCRPSLIPVVLGQQVLPFKE
jgi:hypothetical protein